MAFKKKIKTNENTETETKMKGGITDNEYRASVQHRWIEFTTETRCYVEGIYLEAGQTVTFAPAAAYRQRKNKNIKPVVELTWPTFTEHQLKDLSEGDPRVGAAPKEFTLVQPGAGSTGGGK